MRPLLILLALSLLTACGDDTTTIRQTRYMMGTLVEFTVYGVARDRAETAIRAAAAEMRRVAALFTVHEMSPIVRFNQGKSRLPAEASRLLAVAEDIRRKSDTAFHPALGALNRLWGFSDGRTASDPLPTASATRALRPPAECLQHTQKQWQLRDPRCRIDLGGIAKGYAIDRGIAVLRQHHIANAIINAGGDMRIIGRHGQRKWRIGIRHPRKAGDVVATLDLAGDVSVVTSGDYERFVLVGGKRYHHILDPATGQPADRAMSATVIANSATLADGWSTALFVLGPEGLARLHALGMEGMVVDRYGAIHETAGMRRLHAREQARGR